MLVVCEKLHQIRFGQLMQVYEEGNRENAQDFFPELSEAEQMLRAEQEFYQYLKEVFFKSPKAMYCLWEINGAYVSALRLEQYRDGLLLEALETAPDKRGNGYATELIRAVQRHPAVLCILLFRSLQPGRSTPSSHPVPIQSPGIAATVPPKLPVRPMDRR